MSVSRAELHATHLEREQSALLRSLLLCELAARADEVIGERGWVDPVILEARDALRRLEYDRYGSCETCGRAIPFDELVASPRRRHCAGCTRSPAPADGSPPVRRARFSIDSHPSH